MIICISGLTGSGKTTIGELVAKRLGIAYIGSSYKSMAQDRKALMSLIKRKDPGFHKKFDRDIIKKVNKAKNCVVTTWLSPWMIKKSSLNVWIYADQDIRARRRAKQIGIPYEDSLKFISEKDKSAMRYMKGIYNINILKDHNVFDAEFNTGRMRAEDVVGAILLLSAKKQ